MRFMSSESTLTAGSPDQARVRVFAERIGARLRYGRQISPQSVQARRAGWEVDLCVDATRRTLLDILPDDGGGQIRLVIGAWQASGKVADDAQRHVAGRILDHALEERIQRAEDVVGHLSANARSINVIVRVP